MALPVHSSLHRYCMHSQLTYSLGSKAKGEIGWDRAWERKRSFTLRELTHTGGVFGMRTEHLLLPTGPSRLCKQTHTRTQTAAESNEAEACRAAGWLLQLVSGFLILIPKSVTRHLLFHTIHSTSEPTVVSSWHRLSKVASRLNNNKLKNNTKTAKMVFNRSKKINANQKLK